MLVHMISLISVIAVMIYFVVNLVVTCSYIQLAERPYSHSHFMDGLVDASKEPFVYCYECPMPFWGSPADIVHHLTQACGDHYWPLAKNIKYETCYPFTVPESLEDHRRLLVSEEDGSVFLLIVGTGEARAGCRPVSVMCVRGDAANADTDTRLMYGCVLTVTTPQRYVGGYSATSS